MEEALRSPRSFNWQAGHQIVLTTTALKDSRDWHRNEVLALADPPLLSPPDGAGALLSLASPAQHLHEGILLGIAGLSNRRGRVGRLTRDTSRPGRRIPIPLSIISLIALGLRHLLQFSGSWRNRPRGRV